MPADVAGDAALVERLARWAGRWSPLVEVDGADGLRIDVTGAAHLFGGEAGLMSDVEQRFAGLGLTARVAIAPTAGAAWALARFASPAEVLLYPTMGSEAGRRLTARPLARRRPAPSSGADAGARAARPEDHRRAGRGAAAVAGAAVSRGGQSAGCARPDAGTEARALVGDPGRAAAASDIPAGRAGRRSGGDGTGAGADGRALVRRAGPAAAGGQAGGVPGLSGRRRGRRGRGRDRFADARSGASGAAARRARRDARSRVRVRRVRAGRASGASRWIRRRTR